MHDSPRYRDMAAKCLRAAQETCEPHYCKLQLSMAVSWLSLARQDEAMDDLLAGWDMPYRTLNGARLSGAATRVCEVSQASSTLTYHQFPKAAWASFLSCDPGLPSSQSSLLPCPPGHSSSFSFPVGAHRHHASSSSGRAHPLACGIH